jgi:A-factor type gamma-butyrolactone 1'-reductase (1S-forming)
MKKISRNRSRAFSEQNLRERKRENNIRVNAVNPGAIATSILENTLLKWTDRDPMHPDGIEMFVNKGRNTLDQGIMGDPEDIAEAIRFLISDEARFICGAELTVDGGWTSFWSVSSYRKAMRIIFIA